MRPKTRTQDSTNHGGRFDASPGPRREVGMTTDITPKDEAEFRSQLAPLKRAVYDDPDALWLAGRAVRDPDRQRRMAEVAAQAGTTLDELRAARR